METVTEERILAANGNALAARLLDITKYRSVTTYTVWSDDPTDRDIDGLVFPFMTEECWFSVLGDNSMGNLVDIWNNEEGDLIVTADFGDYGQSEINVHKHEFLHMQKIVGV